jgi:hypothetical protein
MVDITREDQSRQPLSPLFQYHCKSYCGHYHGPRKDDWSHCLECRNRTAKWQSSITYRYLRNHEDRPIRAAILNVVDHEGNHLTRDEVEIILSKFKDQFRNHLPDCGYQLVLDDAPKTSRPHWNGLFLGVNEDDLVVAWHRATKGNYDAWLKFGEIETTLNKTVNYAFKVWGSHRNGQVVRIPVKGVKVIYMHNFFEHATKGQMEAELKMLKFKGERSSSVWSPSEEQRLTEVVTRPTWSDIDAKCMH